MTILEELQRQATRLFQNKEFKKACLIYHEIWQQNHSEANGRALFKCYRKAEMYEEAYDFYEVLITYYPNSKGVELAKLWLDYSAQIKNWKNENIIKDAEEILKKTNKHNDYTREIFNKTILNVAKYLIYIRNYEHAQIWLNKLDFSLLNTSPFEYKGQKNPSDQKIYFKLYADVLINTNEYIHYIENKLTEIGFEGAKHTHFKEKIIEKITYGKHISRTILGLFLKYFSEEIALKERNSYTLIFNPSKITLISNLSDFVFCPASFAINVTFAVPSNKSWEKDEWYGEKKHLIDRYKEFQHTKSFDETFKDSLIEINNTTKSDFGPIFNSKLLISNLEGENGTYYSNRTDTLRGNPDYIFENNNGERFVAIEKFTKRTSESIQAAFSNDLVKVYAYIFEIEMLKIDFGYLIYWYWYYDDIQTENGSIKKKIKIKAYRIFKVEKSNSNKERLSIIINQIKQFKDSRLFSVDRNKISLADKCLNCSVINYCNHKTGKFDLIKLPYEVNLSPPQ